MIETALTGCVQQSRCHVALSASATTARAATPKTITDFCTNLKENASRVSTPEEAAGTPPPTKAPNDVPKKLYDHQLIRFVLLIDLENCANDI